MPRFNRGARTHYRTCALGLATALTAALLVPAGGGGAAAAQGTCAPDAAGAGPFYPGPSASAEYNATFRKGPAIPHGDTHIPQGLTEWRDWNGKGKDKTLLLLGAYRPDARSLLIGIDPDSGRHVGSVRVAEAHLGALGVVGKDWLIAQHENGRSVRAYRVDDLRRAMKKAIRSGNQPYLRAARKTQTLAAANFLSTHQGRAWIGNYSHEAVDALMYQYKVTSAGKLIRIGKAWEVPLRTQGVLVTKDRFVFVSGLTAGIVTVVARGERRLDAAQGRCFSSPSHGQNIVLTGGTVFVAYEGGSVKYAGRPTTRNQITNLHVADRDPLLALTNG